MARLLFTIFAFLFSCVLAERIRISHHERAPYDRKKGGGWRDNNSPNRKGDMSTGDNKRVGTRGGYAPQGPGVFVLAVGIGENGLTRNNVMNWEGGFTHYLTQEVLSMRPSDLDLKVVTIENSFVPQNPQHVENGHLRSAVTEWAYRQLHVEYPQQRTRVSITPRGLPQDGQYATSYPHTVGIAAAPNQHPTEQDWLNWRNQNPYVGEPVLQGANAWQSWSLHPFNIRLSVPSNIPISGWNNGPPCAENTFMAYMGTLLNQPNQQVTDIARSAFRALHDGKHFYFYNEWTFNTNAPATLFLRPGHQPPFWKHRGNTGHHLDNANGYLAAMLLVLDTCFQNRVHYTYRTPGANYRNYNLSPGSLMG